MIQHSLSPASAFIFLRHGQTDWNRKKLLQGRTDTELDATGVDQAHSAAAMLKDAGIGLIVSSPLKRAADTARTVAEVLGLEIHLDDDLMERSFGSYEGMVLSQIPGNPDGLRMAGRRDLPDDAETFEDICARSFKSANRWLEKSGGKRLLIVSHYGVMCTYCDQLLGSLQPAKNATPYLFSPGKQPGDNWSMQEYSTHQLTGLNT